MLLMNSDQAQYHQHGSLYDTIKVRSIMDTTVPGERHDTANIAMKVNVLSSSKSQRDSNLRMAPMDRAMPSNNASHGNFPANDSKKRIANDGFLHRMQLQGRQKRVGYLDFARQLEVTPSSGMVKRIDQ